MEVQFRDAYGFAVRPQHLQRYREYTNIYKEEEEERSRRWADFLERQAEAAEKVSLGVSTGKDEQEWVAKEMKTYGVQIWAQIRPSLGPIAQMMTSCVTKRNGLTVSGKNAGESFQGASLEGSKPLRGAFKNLEDDSNDVNRLDKTISTSSSEDVNVDVDKPDVTQPSSSSDGVDGDVVSEESYFPWKEEFESLVHGGLPMALRGELWQAFVGVKQHRMEGYYWNLLAAETNELSNEESHSFVPSHTSELASCRTKCAPEKWKGQIEKDLPRTFPGHPALDEDGRNALRRLLTAYARHNPLVGYCQAMNFFAGLLLLLMPEENAFWTLVGIIDDYFNGYYTEEMIDSQVDQLVFEELLREKFPKLVKHLDYLGVQVEWVTGAWFLSIFINMLPWESVLRVWDVLLFDGNRTMLFRTALALMELYGPALLTTKDAGDAVTLLQSLAASTFDSSQLVLTACMGYRAVNEYKLQELTKKHRPTVMAAMKEKLQALRACVGPKGLASKFHIFKHDPGLLMSTTLLKDGQDDTDSNGDVDLFHSSPMNKNVGLTGPMKVESVPELKEQVMWLKLELSRLLEEKRSSIIRAEELETALMELVKQDNRCILSAKIEQLEQELAELRQTFAVKQEQESVMIQVLVRVEQEQKVTEDARLFAEQDAAAQKYAAQMLQEKYEEAVVLLAEMEKRAVMAETMLEATLQYQSCQVETQQPQTSSPRVMQLDQESAQSTPTRRNGLLSRPLGLGWRGKSKGK